MIYEKEQNLTKAYILLMRFTLLVLTHLKPHPEYGLDSTKQMLDGLKRNCVKALDSMERIKPVLERHFMKLEAENKVKLEEKHRIASEEQQKSQKGNQNIQGSKEGSLFNPQGTDWWKTVEASQQTFGQTSNVTNSATNSYQVAPSGIYGLPQKLANIPTDLPPPIPVKPANFTQFINSHATGIKPLIFFFQLRSI